MLQYTIYINLIVDILKSNIINRNIPELTNLNNYKLNIFIYTYCDGHTMKYVRFILRL